MKPIIIGVDLARPGSDHTVYTIHGGRQGGKTARMRRIVEQALDDGITVYDQATGEIRGPMVAKDVTPKPKTP